MSSKFSTIMELITYLISLKSGPAYEAFRQSILNDFLAHGYSEVRANQIIDEMVEHVKSKQKS